MVMIRWGYDHPARIWVQMSGSFAEFERDMICDCRWAGLQAGSNVGRQHAPPKSSPDRCAEIVDMLKLEVCWTGAKKLALKASVSVT